MKVWISFISVLWLRFINDWLRKSSRLITYIFDIPIQRNSLYKSAFLCKNDEILNSCIWGCQRLNSVIYKIVRDKFGPCFIKRLLNHLNKRLETSFSWKCPLLKISECLPAGLDVKWFLKDKNSPFLVSRAISCSNAALINHTFSQL